MGYIRRQREEAICHRIADAREAAGLTRDGLARGLTACTGTTVTGRDVRHYESSRVPWELLTAIAQQTGTSNAWLLGGDAGDEGDVRPVHMSRLGTGERARHPVGGRARVPPGIAVVALASAFFVSIAVQRLTGSVPAAVLCMVVIVAVAVGRHMR